MIGDSISSERLSFWLVDGHFLTVSSKDKGVEGNGARVTGVNQDCAGQTRLHGHPTYGLLIFLRFTLAFSKCAVCVKHYILFIYF